jgi:peptidoglycan/LPS O-acetylase OafA/YrhL
MPEPARTGQRYLPGLDGLRAIAVLAVIAYHEQLGWAPGGLLGVAVFFTLSGYLITDLLLGQWSSRGTLSLGDFWLRRARRLLPALFVMLAVVTAWVTLFDRARLGALRSAVAAAAAYGSNWYLISGSGSYFARFAPPGPLDHLWSLAVEEQFYLVWPWLLLLGVYLARRWRPVALAWLSLPVLLLAAASASLMLAWYQPGLDPTRVYEGTDTRAFGLLIGAALALVWSSRRKSQPPLAARALLDGAGMAGLAVIGLMIAKTGQYSPFAYRGGLVLLSVATVAVVAAVAVPGSVVGLALGWRPLRWIGVRSYGIYLWHYPVIVLTTPADAGENLVRAAGQVAASVALAALSWHFIEEPVRHGAIGKLAARLRAAGPRPALGSPARLAGIAAGAAVLVVAVAGVGGAFGLPAASPGTSALASGSGVAAATKTVTRARPQPAVAGPKASPAQLRTSCTSVAHIGDSTSEGLVSHDYLPSPRKRITARYEDVGVQTIRTDISGARSVVEVLPGQANGYDAAKAMVRGGFRGCWVIALGTNDTADLAVGSNVGLMTRISRMMSAAHGEPVMWVNVISLLHHGPYAEPNMQRWDATLLKACTRYPNMRVLNWAALAKPKWFISDGIHYTSVGYAARAKQIADGLARAFPATGSSPGCLVS